MRLGTRGHITFILLFLAFQLPAQINLVTSRTQNVGPGLSIPDLWAQFYGSMNTHIAAQDIIISHKEHQYIGFYNEERKVVLGRRHLCERQWEFLVFDDYIQQQNDRHNHISIGICPNDGTIHLSFDHHVDTLNYRISVPELANYPENYAWEAALFSEVRHYLIPGQIQPGITYPAFFSTTDGHLNMVFRFRGSGNAESYIAFYNGSTHRWEDVHKFIESTGEYQDPYLDYISYSRNAYPFYFEYDKEGWLHTAWVWRESSASRYNHDINYARSPDHGRTWFNNNGEVIGRVNGTDTLYIEYASPGLNVWTIDSRYGMINNGGMTLDHYGQPHIMVFHRVEPVELSTPAFVSYGDGRHHHYWRSPDGTWHKQKTGFRGGRPRLFSDSKGNMYMTFIDRSDSLIASSPYIVRVVISEKANNWSAWHQIYEGYAQTHKNEPPADPVHIRDQGIMSIVSHEFHDYFLNGPMYITDLYTDLEHPSKISIGVEQDAYVMNGSNSNTNFGDSHILVVNDHPGDTLDREIFLQFELSKISELDVEGIIAADLVLGILSASTDIDEEVFQLLSVEDDGWEEMEINWDNAPATSGLIRSMHGDTLFLRFDIREALLAAWTGDGILSLCLRKAQETNYASISFHSKESTASGLSPKIEIRASSSCMQNIGISTGTEEAAEEIESMDSGICVYPNPVSSQKFTIMGLEQYSTQNAIIEIYDLQGCRIMKSSEKINSSGKIELDLGIYPNSLYFLRISPHGHKSLGTSFIICR